MSREASVGEGDWEGEGEGEVRLVSLECWRVQPQWRLGFGQISGIPLSTGFLDAFLQVLQVEEFKLRIVKLGVQVFLSLRGNPL